MKIETLKGRGHQCDQIGLLETIFLRKLAQIFHNFWGDLKNITLLEKNGFGYFFGKIWKYLAIFSFYIWWSPMLFFFLFWPLIFCVVHYQCDQIWPMFGSST